jgi:hypothetical protein
MRFQPNNGIAIHLTSVAKAQPPTASFSVRSIAKAKNLLKGAWCQILVERGSSLYFRGPFGNIFDVIED